MNARNKSYLLFLLLFSVLISLYFLSLPLPRTSLAYDVDSKRLIPFAETRWYYFGILLFSILPVIALSFDNRVRFAGSWKRILRIWWMPAIPFLVWDGVFTHYSVWGFNDRYISGLRLAGLPLEEILFFLCIPFACLFILACVRHYLQKYLTARLGAVLSILVALPLAALFWKGAGNWYSGAAGLGALLVWGYCQWSCGGIRRAEYYITFLLSVLPFLLVNGMLTGIFSDEPVVVYNAREILGIRIWTIPVEDLAYSFALLTLNFLAFDLRSPGAK